MLSKEKLLEMGIAEGLADEVLVKAVEDAGFSAKIEK